MLAQLSVAIGKIGAWDRAIPSWLTEWVSAERGRFGLWLPVFMGAGVVLYFALRSEPPDWAGLAVAVPSVAGAVLARGRPVLRGFLMALAASSIGFASCQWASSRALPLEPLPSKGVTVSAIVRGVEALPAGRRVMLEQVRIEDSGRRLARTVRVKLKPNDPGGVETGDTVRLRVLIRPPSPPAYPGGWDLQRDDYFSGLGGYGMALGPVQALSHVPPRGFAASVRWLRDSVQHRILAVLPGAEGGIAATLMTGITAAIPEPDRAAFRDSGLAHLLAVAGLHIGIVMGLMLGFARLSLALSERASLFWPCKQIAALVALACGGSYMLMTGVHLPILRSFAMACLFTLAVVAGRRAISVRGLALAAVAIMGIEPWEVVGVSFQMSFSAVLALIAGYEAMRPWLQRLHTAPVWGEGTWGRRLALHVAALALTSFLAGTASAPYAAYHFGRVQIYYVISNMVAVPLTAMWVMPAGLIALALMPLGLEALALVPMGWGIDAILWIAHTASDLPAATFAVPHMPAWGLAVLSLGIAWLGIWRTRWRLAGVAAIALGLLSPLVWQPPDMLVSADARLIGLRTGQGVFVEQANGGSRFTQDAWQQYWAAADMQPMPRDLDDDAITCEPGACLLRPRADGVAALLLQGSRNSPFCADAAVLVSAAPVRDACPPPSPPLVDRFTVWREGAAAIWLEPGGARILTDRAERGDRPWVTPAPVKRGAELPVAQED
jgi:competence protein ComEC